MRVRVHVLALPKAGHTPDECEDACLPARSLEWTGASLRVAVADGASEGMLSGRWARILVKRFCRGADDPATLLDGAHRAWRAWLGEYLRGRERRGRPLQWFEEPGFATGAFATFLGVVVEDDGTWRATALGDTCLFQVRDGALVASFPLDAAAAFDSRPLLVASDPARNAGVLDAWRTLEGAWRAGDVFYLATDALAAWLLREVEAGGSPWARADAADAALIAELRGGGRLRNDDVTLVRVG